jgi:hypothetical protein
MVGFRALKAVQADPALETHKRHLTCHRRVSILSVLRQQ